jgi:hypothetical protein
MAARGDKPQYYYKLILLVASLPASIISSVATLFNLIGEQRQGLITEQLIDMTPLQIDQFIIEKD